MEYEYLYQSGVLELEDFCPARLNSAQEIVNQFSVNAKTSLDDTNKYYASQLLAIKHIKFDTLHLLEHEASSFSALETDKVRELIDKAYKLLKLNDSCDKVGVSFLKNIIDHFCPSGANYNNLPQDIRSFFDANIFHSSKKIALKATELSHCNDKKHNGN